MLNQLDKDHREFSINQIFSEKIDFIKDIKEVYGTPIYVFSEKKLRENIKQLKESFTKYYPNTKIAYSLKNNMILAIIEIIAEEVDLFETTSLLEVKIVENIIDYLQKPLNIISTNLFKPKGLVKTLGDLHQKKIKKEKNPIQAIIAIDSLQDYQLINEISKETNQLFDVLVRVNPGIKMSTQKTVFASAMPLAKSGLLIKNRKDIIERSNKSDINEWFSINKFNLQNDYAENIIQKVEANKNLNLLGLHGHVGSQITDITYFDHFFEIITIFQRLMEEKLEKKFEILDLGGGYPVNYHSDRPVPSIEKIAKTLVKKMKKQEINSQLIIESGRYITASAGVFLTSVQLVKEHPVNGHYVIVDTSVYSDLLDIIAADWLFEIQLLSDKDKKVAKKHQWEIIGITNDTLDQLTPLKKSCPKCGHKLTTPPKRFFSRKPKKGDLLAILNTGAYTTCFNSNYCGHPKPLRLIIRNSKQKKLDII